MPSTQAARGRVHTFACRPSALEDACAPSRLASGWHARFIGALARRCASRRADYVLATRPSTLPCVTHSRISAAACLHASRISCAATCHHASRIAACTRFCPRILRAHRRGARSQMLRAVGISNCASGTSLSHARWAARSFDRTTACMVHGDLHWPRHAGGTQLGEFAQRLAGARCGTAAQAQR